MALAVGSDFAMDAVIDALNVDVTGGVTSSEQKLSWASESMRDAPVGGVDRPGAGGGGGGRGNSEAVVSIEDNLSMSLLFQTSVNKVDKAMS